MDGAGHAIALPSLHALFLPKVQPFASCCWLCPLQTWRDWDLKVQMAMETKWRGIEQARPRSAAQRSSAAIDAKFAAVLLRFAHDCCCALICSCG